MKDKTGSVIEQIKELEKELAREFQRKEVEFLYRIRMKKVEFTSEAKIRHRGLVKRAHRYLLESRFLVLLTAPVIWFCLVPLAFLDLVLMAYQAVCFPIYGIPKARRSDYLVTDRNRLAYLNLIEKLNCVYCGYANGLLAYAVEIAGRTEQYFCPIKHALRMKSTHNRYGHFLEYGDADGYRNRIEEVRRSFEDLEPVEEDENGSGEK